MSGLEDVGSRIRVVREIFDSCPRLFSDDTEEVRRLGMGRLLSDVSEKMHAKALEGERNRLKLLVHSTHDTTLAGICKTLEVFDEK